MLNLRTWRITTRIGALVVGLGVLIICLAVWLGLLLQRSLLLNGLLQALVFLSQLLHLCRVVVSQLGVHRFQFQQGFIQTCLQFIPFLFQLLEFASQALQFLRLRLLLLR